VERALRAAGVEHGTVRVPMRKRERDEVQELSGQRHVPLLEIGEETICDSKRIVEFLSRRGRSASAPGAARP
jgi:glutathione S-transferase